MVEKDEREKREKGTRTREEDVRKCDRGVENR